MSRAFVLVVLALATLVVGCGGDRVVLLREWQLHATARKVRDVTLPAKIPLDASDGAFILRTRVPLDDALRGRDLTLAIPLVESRVNLLANEVPVASIDDPGTGFRGLHAPRFRIPPQHGEFLDIALQVRHDTPQSEFLSTIPRLSPTSYGDARYLATRSFNVTTSWIALGALIGMFVTYAALWAFDRRRIQYGLLALAAIFATLSPLHWLDLAQHLFGRLELLVVSEALALAAFGVMAYTFGHFGRPPPSRAWWWLGLALLVLTIVAGFTANAQPAAQAFGLFCSYAVIVRMTWMLLGLARLDPRPRDVSMMLVAVGLLFLSTVPVALWRLGIQHPFEGIVLTPVGFTAFLLLHSVTLSRVHVASLRTTEALNVELAARIEQLEERNQEIGTLNVELRRQIADRSQKLAEALARIEGVPSTGRAIREGELIDERYRVLHQLGQGGMGAVYEVARLSDGKHLAMKVLRGETTGAALSRFAREAEIAARIDHPNLVSVVDVDVAESGALYIVMELVDGTPLDDLRERYGDATWAVPILRQVAEGLAALHGRGVVHRDLKPGNVLVDKNGRAKISDFGISALREVVDPLGATRTPEELVPKSDPSLTQPGALLGTPLYMAPELLHGADRANEASDVFSLGLVGYGLLTGRMPWSSPPIYEVSAGRPLSAPEPITGCDPDIAAIVLRCLSLPPSERPTASEVAQALSPR